MEMARQDARGLRILAFGQNFQLDEKATYCHNGVSGHSKPATEGDIKGFKTGALFGSKNSPGGSRNSEPGF